MSPHGVAALDLDLDIFSGPFDLLLTLILREEVDLLELALADVVLAYLDHLDSRNELDLETATEFIVLIAALLELKSKLMLAHEDAEELLDIEPEQAAEELLTRMLDAHRYRSAAIHLKDLLTREEGVRFRQAPPPAHLRRAELLFEKGRTGAERAGADGGGVEGGGAEGGGVEGGGVEGGGAEGGGVEGGGQDPALLGEAIGRLLALPPAINLHHISAVRVTVAERLAHLRGLLRRGSFSFEEAVQGADRMTVAITLFALLELYKRGEAHWRQTESFGEITIEPAAGSSAAAHRPAPVIAVAG